MASPRFPIQVTEKVKELLAEMSLAQKVGQMTQADQMTCTPDEVYEYGLGSVLSSAGSSPTDNCPNGWLDMCEAFWQASMTPRVNGPRIPIMYGLDAVHGHNNAKGATIFPHNIGMGAVDDTQLLAKAYEVTRREVLCTGVDWVFGPNLAVAKDLRWGRTYESFSELPEKVASFAAPAITSLQNDLQHGGVIACAKHWVGDGGTEFGRDQGDTRIPFEELKKEHIAPYVKAIDAGVLTIMASFSSWNGTKCHANEFLLTKLLKQQMGFSGFVLSDMQGIEYVSHDFYSAVEKSVNAGIDMFMVPENWKLFIEHLTNHVEMGTIPMSRINDAVSRILSVKLTAGLFEKPSPKNRVWANHECFGSEKHRSIAREAVSKSLVLLKNEHNTLPLESEKKILVCGKNAHNIGHQCGGFTLNWQGDKGNDNIRGDSIWQGIKSYCSHAELIQEQDIDADDYELAIVVIGEEPYAEGIGDIRTLNADLVEAGSQIHGHLNVTSAKGATLALSELYPEDLALLKRLKAQKLPVIAVLVSGRPMVVDRELELADAFVAAWLPGSEGKGVADVLFGERSFSGKLPFTWPKSEKSSGSKHFSNAKTLYPVGYGLEYESVEEKATTSSSL